MLPKENALVSVASGECFGLSYLRRMLWLELAKNNALVGAAVHLVKHGCILSANGALWKCFVTLTDSYHGCLFIRFSKWFSGVTGRGLLGI